MICKEGCEALCSIMIKMNLIESFLFAVLATIILTLTAYILFLKQNDKQTKKTKKP